MEILVLFAIGAAGTVFPPLNPELASIGFGTRGYHPLAVGAVTAAGQCAVYLLVYFGGEKVIAKWKALATQVERVRTRFAAHLEERYLVAAVVAGLVGIPPAIALVALAGGFRVPVHHVMPVVYVSRLARFAILAAFGQQIYGWLGKEV